MVKKSFVKHLQNLLQMRNHLIHSKSSIWRKVVDNFRKLQKADFTKYLSQPDNVMEKYDDYKYSYESMD